MRDDRLRHARQDRVPARADGCDVAVAETGDLDDGEPVLCAFLCLGEQVARAEAVANRAGAHPNAVVRQLEVRVERDDLRHLAAPDVHVVGERVGELGSHRPDATADRPEVVEQLGALARQCVHRIAKLLHDASIVTAAARGLRTASCRASWEVGATQALVFRPPVGGR